MEHSHHPSSSSVAVSVQSVLAPPPRTAAEFLASAVRNRGTLGQGTGGVPSPPRVQGKTPWKVVAASLHMAMRGYMPVFLFQEGVSGQRITSEAGQTAAFIHRGQYFSAFVPLFEEQYFAKHENETHSPYNLHAVAHAVRFGYLYMVERLLLERPAMFAHSGRYLHVGPVTSCPPSIAMLGAAMQQNWTWGLAHFQDVVWRDTPQEIMQVHLTAASVVAAEDCSAGPTESERTGMYGDEVDWANSTFAMRLAPFAARYGSLGIFQCIHQQIRRHRHDYTENWVLAACVAATRNTRCCMAILEWVHSNYHGGIPISGSAQLMESACELRHLEWLYRQGFHRLGRASSRWVAARDHVVGLEWIHNHGAHCGLETLYMAPWKGRYHSVAYLVERLRLPIDESVYDAAASCNHLAILELLHRHNPDALTHSAVMTAVVEQTLPCVKFMLRVNSGLFDSAALNYVAQCGDLDLLRCILEQAPIRPTTDTVNVAAASGHDDMVRWLHESHNV